MDLIPPKSESKLDQRINEKKQNQIEKQAKTKPIKQLPMPTPAI
jgi:hypothetical protein